MNIKATKISNGPDDVFLGKYLHRIQYPGIPKNDLVSLFTLQRQHLLSVPFENLDIHLHKSIQLSLDDFYDKIVVCKRGGFCYELNGLFNALLEVIGFKTNIISARVFQNNGEIGDEFDHLCIIVFLGKEKWLVDVGFGEFSFSPLLIELAVQQQDSRGVFKIESYSETALVVQKKVNDVEWKNEYLFSEIPRQLSDFSARCVYQQISPESHFTKNKLCSMPTETGRITLTDSALKIMSGDSVEETEISDLNQFKVNLKKYFGIELPFSA